MKPAPRSSSWGKTVSEKTKLGQGLLKGMKEAIAAEKLNGEKVKTLKELRDSYIDVCCDRRLPDNFDAGAKAVMDEAEKLAELLQRALVSVQAHRDKGHNDTCSYALTGDDCDCGMGSARDIARDSLLLLARWQAFKDGKDENVHK